MESQVQLTMQALVVQMELNEKKRVFYQLMLDNILWFSITVSFTFSDLASCRIIMPTIDIIYIVDFVADFWSIPNISIALHQAVHIAIQIWVIYEVAQMLLSLCETHECYYLTISRCCHHICCTEWTNSYSCFSCNDTSVSSIGNERVHQCGVGCRE